MMENKNLNLFYYKTYYNNIGKENFTSDLASNNETLEKSTLQNTKKKIGEVYWTHSFQMETNYPGAMIGIGYAHGSGMDGANDDIKCGFSFDYVSGLPYLPGSSVKGILRNAFRICPEAVKEFLKSKDAFKGKDFDCRKLEDAIFGDKDHEDGDDIFFDAVIVRGGKDGRFLGSEYITPHPSPFKNPVPIRMIKLIPNVIFEFRFLLQDTKIGENTITQDDKSGLFTSLLELMGIGAKTNVGYGAMKKVDQSEQQFEVEIKPPEQKEEAQNKPEWQKKSEQKKPFQDPFKPVKAKQKNTP